MLKHVACFLMLLCSNAAWADAPDAVVMVDGCSGVCIDPTGLVLTVRHCDLPETVTVRFKDRTVTATRIYVCREQEGPVVYDCEGTGYPFLPVAASAPRIGERLWSFGYPHINNRRELRWTSGPLLRWSTFEYAGGSFNGNVVGFATCPGWSGGPLINAKGEVCGLLNSTGGGTSVFVSSASVREACAATRPRVEPDLPSVVDGRPKLYVFGSMSCSACRRFKEDYAAGNYLRRVLDATFAVEFVDVDKQPDLARQFGVSEVPAFQVPGRRLIVGYDNADSLLIALGLRQEIVSQPAPQRDIAPVDPNPPATPATAEVPTIPVNSESTTVPPMSLPTTPPVLNTDPAADTGDAIDRMSGLVEKAVTLATWLGVGGLSGGAGGLALGGIALWRTFRKRRRDRTGRDPPTTPKPSVVTVGSPPPPQAIVPETRFAPYERDTFAEAFAWAETELVRKYPGAVGTLESLRGLIDQYLAARGVKRPSVPSSSR